MFDEHIDRFRSQAKECAVMMRLPTGDGHRWCPLLRLG
jgi:hypothetical protein